MRCNIYKTLCLGISYLITYRRVCDKSPGDPASPEGSEFWVLNGFCCSLFKKKKALEILLTKMGEQHISQTHDMKMKMGCISRNQNWRAEILLFYMWEHKLWGEKMVLIIFSFMNSLIMDVLCVFPKTLVYTWKLTWMNAAHDCRVTHVFE